MKTEMNKGKRMLTGSTKASAVQAKAPERLMKRPNFGTIMASTAVSITIRVRIIMFLAKG